MMNIPITRAVFDDAEKQAVIKPLETGWVVQGPYVKEFEQLFAEFTGSKHAKALSNCTTALHLALLAAGVKRGDKVVAPSFTYVATANAAECIGAEVIFCDIDLATFNISVPALENILKSTSGIKALLPVNLFGLCADMPAIMKLADKYKVIVIEDSACGFDGWIGKKHSGTFGHMGCFSFHPRKSITTGEGGMLITDNKDYHAAVSQLCDHGASKSDLQRHKEKGGSLLPDFNMVGYNYRMTDIQGAIGVAQIKKADRIMKGRRGIAAKYDKALKDVGFLATPVVPKDYVHGYQSYVCLFHDGQNLDNLTVEKVDKINVKRNAFMEYLEQNGIATRQGTHAVHTLGFYRNAYKLKAGDFINSYAADRLSIALPVYCGMNDEEFNYVIEHMKKAKF